MERRIIFLVITVVLACLSPVASQEKPPQEGVSLTIYNDDFAVVRDLRTIHFDKGRNRISFTGVAAAIDPTTVNFRCLSSPAAVSVLEQNYEYDLVSTDSLLKRYIDRAVTVRLKGSGADTGRQVSGQLLAALGGDLIVRSQDGEIEIMDRAAVEDILLKELPGDLVTRPTLVWLADAVQQAEHLCQVAYTTGRIGWKADYLAVLGADEANLDFSGWVTIDNKSGATYKDAFIKLIAGDVRRIITEPQPRYQREAAAIGGVMEGFEEKPFMEYHLYTLRRKSDINNNQVKQIEFISPATAVPVKKLYIYERSGQAGKIQIKLEFENAEQNGLGIALPKGRVRVFKRDPADGMLEFVGEDEIDHTARKEKLRLYIGNAFDIVAEYTLIDSKHDRRLQRETHKIELRNRKTEAVTVFVDEKFPSWVNWTISESTHKYEKRDAHTARFEVKIAADSVATVQYTATQSW